MSPFEIRTALRKQPFEPFRLVMTDGGSLDIRHPDLLWVGQESAHVGLTGDPAQTLFERFVFVDLAHIIRLEPLPLTPASKPNGQTR